MRFDSLRTERLLLRPFALEHVDPLHALFVLPEVRRYLLDDEVIAREHVVEFVEESEGCFDEHGYGLCVIEPRDAAGLLGFCGLRRFDDPDSGCEEPELLYGLAPEYWGRGYATEASGGVLRFGFEACGLDPIHAGIDPPNARSRLVIERLGMRDWRRIQLGGLPADYARLQRARFDPGAADYVLDPGSAR